MGIKDLNKFFKENASNSIKLLHLKELDGKKIAIDISIYLYKFSNDEDSLIENIYLMLSILKFYNITPLFIFDGKPPIEKTNLLLKRGMEKKIAKNEFLSIQEILINNKELKEEEKNKLIHDYKILKNKFVHFTKNDVALVKKLIISYGASYLEAEGEADELCALLVMKEKVWACMSEDMDLFVYGCPRVLRYFSLVNHSVVIYNLKEILFTLGLNLKDLREICILSGTDYSNIGNTFQLTKTFKYFKKYIKTSSDLSIHSSFYHWLHKNIDSDINIEELQNIDNLFDLNNNNNYDKIINNLDIKNNIIQKEQLHSILKLNNFIFPLLY